MPDYDDLELTSLEDVGGVDDDLVGRKSDPYADVLECRADVVSLVAVGDADRNVTRL